MFAAIADHWVFPSERAEDTTAPPPKPRPQPLLMGDILMTRGGEPEFLRRWREDRDRLDR